MCQVFHHRYFSNYALYCVGYILLGMVFSVLGPLIPYYSSSEDRPISDYSILFIMRSIGYIAGSFSIKIVQKYCTYHQCIAFGFLVSGSFSLGFYFTDNMIVRYILLFFASVGASYFDIFSNISTIQCFKEKYLEGSLQLLHGCMGLGGFIVPFLVYALQEKVWIILGSLSIFLAFVPFLIKSPQIKNISETLQALDSESSSQKDHKNQSINEDKNQDSSKSLPLKVFLFFCLIFFLSLACEAIYGAWIATYAVDKGYNTKQQATIYNSIFWGSITFFRLLFVIIPGKPSIKISLLTILGSLSTLLFVYIIVDVNHQVGLILSTVIIGLCDAPLFGLIQSEPTEFQYNPEQKQISTLMIFTALGQGLCSALVGLLYNITVPEIIFYVISFVFFVILITNIAQIVLMKKHLINKKEDIEIQEVNKDQSQNINILRSQSTKTLLNYKLITFQNNTIRKTCSF